MIEAAFIHPVWIKFNSHIDNNKLINYSYQLKTQSTGRTASNFGGWQSESIEERVEELGELVDEITFNCNEFHKAMGYKSSYVHRISNMWININGKGHMNHPHTHPGSVLSGVYYVKCNPKTSGRIMFTSPHSYHCNEDHIETFTPATSGKYFQWPEENKLLIFPAHMCHYVEPSQDDDDRISISFNTALYREDQLRDQ
jgi:uncharacterized protein (TIGR02466 family)